MEKHPRSRPAPVLALVFILSALGRTVSVAEDSNAGEPAKPVFMEIWAYLMQGEEKLLTGDEPVTHICYFSAALNKNGRITSTVQRPDITLKDGVKPEVHLVITELSNPSLMHFSLDPQYGVRPLLIEDICRLAEGFDGVQIDFESVSPDDAEYFFGFLDDLKNALPEGIALSVAVPARTDLKADAYVYSRIASAADRMIIMAYDEHWSGSSPGPVASIPWCSKVVDYAQSAVENGKIVMGLPLYGRAWQDKRLARALRFKNVQDIIAEKNSQVSYESERGAYFEYPESVVVKVFYDDDRSIAEKLRLYRDKGISAVSFWRIGQGPPELWNSIDNARSGPLPADAGELASTPAADNRTLTR